MIILGVDPGIALTGWGFVSRTNNGRLSMVECGCIKTKADLELSARLKIIYSTLLDLIKKYKPEGMAVEELFFAKEARTVAQVGHARGVILLTAAITDTPVFEYNPRHVKTAVTGYGSADKNQIQQMVKVILGLTDVPKPDDTADALAIAICHLNTAKWEKHD